MNCPQFSISRLFFRSVVLSGALLASVAHADPALPDSNSYRDLANACPTKTVQQRFVARGKSGEYRFHAIELAAGEEVNEDLYEIEIQKFPTLDGKVATPKALFDRFRVKLG